MRRGLALAFAALTVSSAFGIELVTNGNFELGNTGWTEASSGGFQIIGDWSTTTVSSAGNLGPPTITAWLGGYDDATDSVTQSVLTPALAASATLQFDYYWVNEDIAGFDFLRVFLGTTEVFVFDLGDNNPVTLNGPTHQVIDVTGLMNGLAQDLKFQVTTDEIAGSSAFIDNVSLDYVPVPEPASIAVLSLGALALLRKRRS